METPAARRMLTVGLVMMITLAAFETLATATVMPAVKDDLGGVALYGWSFSAFLLASLVGITFAGEQSDRHGPARPLTLGLALFVAGLAIGGIAPEMWVLIVGRAVQGLGAGAIPPVAYVAVGRAYPESERPRMMALFATAWVVPGLVGPGLAGVTAEYLSWRLVFLAILPLVGAAALLTLPALRRLGPPEHKASSPAATRIPVAFILAIGASLVLGGLTVAHSLLTPLLVVAGIVLAVPTLRRLMPAGTFRAAFGLPATIVGIAALNLAFFGADAFVPFMLTESRGVSTVFVGAVFTISTLCWTSATWVVERAKGRVSGPTFVATGLGLVALGTALHLLVLHDDVPVAAIGLTWSLAAFGIGLAYPSLSLLLLAQAPEDAVGTASASGKLAEALAAAIGAGLAGAIVNAGENRAAVSEALAISFVLMATVAAFGTLIAFRLPGRRAGLASVAPREGAQVPAGGE